LLAPRRRVIAPSHPGFGRSSLPDWLDSVDDIAHVYLELLDRLALTRTDVIGLSLGGWIAAELATKVPERIDHLVLIAPVGVKTGGPDQLDIPDIFAMSRDKLDRYLFHDPARNAPDLAAMPDEKLYTFARNRETLALLTWEPYMHNPKLKHRLHRVNVPTLFLRGVSDGIVSAEYLERYAALIPKARTDTIGEAGHLPQVEQPGTTAAKVLHFLEEGKAAETSGARP
jgi:pimeloyl-ACP methyl ester carboxylesterase